jgi:hypothetical protein
MEPDYVEQTNLRKCCQAFVLCYWAEREIRKNYPKLLVARSTNRMQFDPQINTERDRLSEIVKMKSAWRGIKILRVNWFHPFQTFKTFQSLPEGGRRLDGYFFFLWLAHPALMIRVVSSSFLLLSVYAISRTLVELLLANRKRRGSISE